MRLAIFAVILVIAQLSLPAARAEGPSVAQQVATRLHGSGQLEGYSIGVKHKSGTVWLKGEVANQAQAESAMRLARSTPSVQQVVNNLTIRDGQPATRPAAATAQKPARVAQQPAAVARNASARRMTNASAHGEVMPASTTVNQPLPMYAAGAPSDVSPAVYDQPNMPSYAWPSYAAYPNYAAVSYPKQYSPMAWPYIGPFYPYPQVPLGWRKVTLEWDDGWWMLDFKD